MKNISVIKNDAALKVLDDLSGEITAALGNDLKEIILYGSYARNEQTEESDMDIVVLIDGDAPNIAGARRKLSTIKVDLSLKYDLVISILIKKYRQYLKHRDFVPFYSTLYNEGISVYG